MGERRIRLHSPPGAAALVGRWLRRHPDDRVDADPLGGFAARLVERLVDQADLVVAAGTRDGRLSFLSPTGVRLLGAPPRWLWDVVAPASRPGLRALLDEGRQSDHVTVVFAKRDGTTVALDCGLSLAGDRFLLVERTRRQTREVGGPVEELKARMGELERSLADAGDELREAIRRVVAARDDERRRLRQDLHDGAQQQLLAVGIGLELAAELAKRQPELHDRIVSLRAQLDRAVDALREIAHGIFPAPLAEHGIVEGLRSAVHGSLPPVDVRAVGIERYSAEIESAVYYSCLEAVQNAVKHARAGTIVVDLLAEPERIRFSVLDDGRGFRAATPKEGGGLRNVADRMRAVAGELRIESSTSGTTISGAVPLEPGRGQAAGSAR